MLYIKQNTILHFEMGSVLSSYKSTRKQRKMRRELRQHILSVKKHNKEVCLTKIPKVSPMVIMKDLGKELRSMSDSDIHGQPLCNESFVEGRTIPKASPMVIMKKLNKELRSLSTPDVEASILGLHLCSESFVAAERPPASSVIMKDQGK